MIKHENAEGKQYKTHDFRAIFHILKYQGYTCLPPDSKKLAHGNVFMGMWRSRTKNQVISQIEKRHKLC